MDKKYKLVPSFNDHGSSCKGHANWMLDCDMTKKEEREIMVTAIDNYLPKNEA